MTAININYFPGRHGTSSPVLGSKADELAGLRLKVKEKPILKSLEEALHGESSHSCNHLYVIPYAKKSEADVLAKEIFTSYVDRYELQGITSQNAIDWVPNEYWNVQFQSSSPGLTIRKKQDRRNGLGPHLHAAVAEAGRKEANGYLPAYIIAYHEFQHVEELTTEESSEDEMRGLNFFLHYKL